jgi:hypothetical protein
LCASECTAKLTLSVSLISAKRILIDQMNEIIESSQVVFLLGAGASTKANVPDTYEFVKLYLRSIEGLENSKTISFIITKLKDWKSTQQGKNTDIDIELLR